MPTEAVDELLTDQLRLVEALHHIAAESEDADIVRYAMGALMATQTGQSYLNRHPVLV